MSFTNAAIAQANSLIAVHQIPRYRQCFRLNKFGIVRDVYSRIIDRGDQFICLTGLTPQSFEILYQKFCVRAMDKLNMTKQKRHARLINKNLLFLLLFWLRHYPTTQSLSAQFNIHPRKIQRLIRQFIPVLSSTFGSINWPSLSELRNKTIYDPVLGNICGYIDGTRHRIQRPAQLCPVPQGTWLLGDRGFANKPPVLTPFKSNELRRVGLTEQQRLAYNNRLASYRIGIEHVTRDIKLYKVMADPQRHFKMDKTFWNQISNCVFGLSNIRFDDFNTDSITT
ncbi:unnamed protein product [Didymodactylos carnosus]|uniref:DDE Tnp4 domain-containing protein n=1 Tax=Didymodactylos carnosus TaxID=1234261 RepID=A0A8S2Y0E0_9BILA|nr:unnamed protein product [Didymodactylos carnosus]